ncbi:TadE family protein [Lysobacter korlensis]|uniref:TadE family protein n=1 Tax=Lysobacter korlensis TaxID=553636 RepID=A0ABV6RHV7_9GAMM
MTRRLRGPARRLATGQGMVEFAIVVPVLMFLILSVVQLVLLYRAKATVDYAALEAARAGAVHGASKDKIEAGFARGITPLFATDSSVGGAMAAWGRAKGETWRYADIEIISPSRAAWNEFRELQHDGRYALPNDSLAFRSNRVGRSGVNVQDANVLKIKVTYRYPLVVPFVGWVLKGKSERIKVDSPVERARMQALMYDDRLPIESYAIVRMQSPIGERAAQRLP